ncbi:unnamed protein product [Paramecium pentaurelia]|uniref:Uncharacterized protein n=1 Tax=Paramecium pentaurelia TaxID=43138 RepID=A0A8S1X4B2_9CILI|nr:unnamed protein product [Paramecium pentaurelia]
MCYKLQIQKIIAKKILFKNEKILMILNSLITTSISKIRSLLFNQEVVDAAERRKDKNIDENFAFNLQTFTQIIVQKSLNFQDKMYQDEVLSAFQWFQNNKDQFHRLCHDESLITKNYDLIEKMSEQLMKQLTIYIKLSSFLFYSLLQICNDLFRIIFSYQLKNKERYMQEDIKQRFLGYILEIESQIKVEVINIWFNGVDFELQMIKTCIAHCRTNSEKSMELAISIMCGLMTSLSQLKPSDQLINSLIEGGKYLLLNFYDKQIQNPLQIYEIYYFFENLKWSILNQLKLGYSIQNIINQIKDGYLKYIKESKDWMIHHCWVNLISDLMCYRPIIHKNQLTNLLSQGTLDQAFWELLINKNLIIQLPYNKFAGKLKIFEEQNLILKKFRTLKLFQEFNQTNSSNLELLKALITQLKSFIDKIINDLEAVKQQVILCKSLLQNNNQIEIKIIKQDIIFFMCQIKQYSFLLKGLINEINLLVNKELLVNSIFQKILQGNCETLKENQTTLKQNILILIQEIEKKYETEFLNNLKIVSRFWIQICQFTTISHEELILHNLELQDSLEPKINQNIIIVNNINKYLDTFIVQISTINRNFLSILELQQFKCFIKEPISQRSIALQIIKQFNPNLILYLVNEIHEHFQEMLQQKLDIEKVFDIRHILKMVYSNLKIYKGLKMILKLHQRKLISIQTQLEGVFQNSSLEVERQCSNQNDIYKYIHLKIMDRKKQLQMLFKKHQNGEFTKDVQIDFNNITNQINKEKNEINNNDWLEHIKFDYILLLSNIQMKLEMMDLVQQNNIVIQQEIITLLDGKLQEINQVDKTKEILQKDQDQVQLNQEKQLKLQMKDLYDCESSFQMIENLINNSKKLKRIFQSHLLDTTSQQSQINQQLLNNLKNTFTASLNQTFIDLLQQTLKCQFIIKLQNQANIEYIPAITQIYNFNTLIIEDKVIQNSEIKVNKIQNMIMQFKNETKTNYKEGFFDIFQNSSYKVRELLVFNLIKLQSKVQEQTISEFCENLLKQIWIIEKHPSVRNLLKNEEMIMMQKKLLKTEMQAKLKQISQIETQLLLNENQDEMKLLLQQAYDNFEIYLDNITDMSQRLDISLIFLREISKDLKNIKSSIDQVLVQKMFKMMQEDQEERIFRNYQTQESRRFQCNSTRINQIKFIYRLQLRNMILSLEIRKLIALANQYDNFDGEVNEFLWSDYEKNKDIMLIKGKAGSGKSRASRNIEELIWNCDKFSPNWIPIYVSLPSLIDPNHNIIDQALESENYNFDKIQVREFKEAIINGNLKIVLILESYDEMKFNFIGTNLYQTNRLAQDLNIKASGLNVKIIITTRDEILNSIGYQTWFYGQSIDTLKEVEILPFSREQSSQYIKLYVQISIKRTIKKFYEFLKQLKSQNFQLDEFRLIWTQLENIINSIIQQQKNSEVLFSNQDAEQLIQKIQTVEFFSFINSNQMVFLKKELLQLWGEQMFVKVIQNINIFHLMSTPFMMEIIVYILPKMLQFYSSSNLIRDILQKKLYAKKSETKIEKYSSAQNFQRQNKIRIDEQKLEFEILEQFNSIIEDLDNQNFFESFSLANSIEFINYINLQHLIFTKFFLQHESFLLDLQDFSIYLAIDMSQRQITQVNYQQKGKLFIQQVEEERRIEVSWEDAYFSENQENFEYKGLLRKCMLINQKGGVYAFNHKSIQEYFVAKYLLNLFQKIFINEKQIVNETSLYKSSFNKDLFNLSQENYTGTLELLKPKITKIQKINQKLIQLALLSKIDSDCKYVRSASNSLFLLGYLKEHFENIDFSKMQLADTKLNGISFYKCNLNNTKFQNVSIDSCNFNCSKIENANWINMICKEKPSLFGHKSKINQIAFSEEGNNLISSSKDGVINLWQLQGNEEPKSVSLPNNEILLKFSKSNNLLVCLAENTIYLFNPNELSQIRYQTITNYEYQDLYLSYDSKYLAAETISNQIQFWQIQNLRQKQYSCQQKYISKGKNQILLGVLHSPKILNSQLLDIQEILEFPKQDSLINAITFSKDCKILVTGGENKKIEFWNIENLNQVYLLFSLCQQNRVEQISYSNDGKYFASRSDSSLKLYEEQQILDQQDFFRIQIPFQVGLIEISSNTQILAFCKKSSAIIQIWDIKNLHQNKMLCTFEEQKKNISCLKFRNDSLVLGSASQDKTICLWDLQKQRLIVKLEAHTDEVLDFGFSIDGTKMVSCSYDKTIIFWNLINLDKQQVQLQMQLPIQANKVMFWPNTQFVVSSICKQSKEIKLWDSNEFNLIQSLEIEEIFLDIHCSIDGEFMASLCENNILRLWKICEQSIKIDKKIKLNQCDSVSKIHLFNNQSIIVSGYHGYQLKIQEEGIIKILHCFNFVVHIYCMSVAQNQKFIVREAHQGVDITIIENQISRNIFNLANRCNDFQFSNDSSLIAVATSSGAFIKNIRTNQIILNLKQDESCISVCFIGQDQLAIGQRKCQFILYSIKDSQSTQKLTNIYLPCIPSKLLFIEQRQQMCIYSNKSYLILLNLSKLNEIQLVQVDKGNKSLDFVLDSSQLFLGVGFQNDIYFCSLSDTIQMEKVFQPQENLQLSLYKNFALNDSNIFTIVSKTSIYTQFDINSNVIQNQDLKFKYLTFLTFNYQQTQFITIEEYYEANKKKQKSSLIDFETSKTISCFEVIDDIKFHQSKKVVFSQDGLYFVSSYSDLLIKLWDAKTCKLLSMFKSNTPSIELIKISKRGIIAQTSEQTIKLWNLKALKQQQFEMDGHSDSVKSLCISSDGFQLVSGSNSEIIIWDLLKLKKIDTLLKGEQLPTSFCFSHNCQYFAALDDLQGIHIWKLNTKYIMEHFYILSCINLAFSFDSTQLICQQSNSKILILNIEQVCKQKKIQFQQNQNFTSRSIILSKHFLIKTNPLEVIQANKSELKYEEMQGIQLNKVGRIAFCINTMRLAIEDQNYSIIIWSIEKQKKESVLQDPSLENIKVQSMSFSGNSKLLFSFYHDKKIRVWDVSEKFMVIKVEDFWAHKEGPYSSIKEEKYVFISLENNFVWDSSITQIFCHYGEAIELENGQYQTQLSRYQVGFCEANNLLAIQFINTLNLYDVSQKKRELIAKLEGNFINNSFSSILVFSEDGNNLLSQGNNQTITMWDILDKNSIKVKLNLTQPVEALKFLFLDSQTIRIFSKSGEIIDKAISDFTEIGVVEDQKSNDSTNHKQLIEISRYIGKLENTNLQIFDAEEKQLKYTLSDFSSIITDIKFTPSGKQFILGMKDGSILLYSIDKQTLQDYELPVCYYKFAKSQLIQAFCCKISQSEFKTFENLEKLFYEKGAIK